jgi:four helix bundle protein
VESIRLGLETVSAYRKSFGLSNFVWDIVQKWNPFERTTLGKHLVNSVDAISASISGGYCKERQQERIQLYQTSKGSIGESLDWIQKARVRGLVTDKEYYLILGLLNELPRELNQLINTTSELDLT